MEIDEGVDVPKYERKENRIDVDNDEIYVGFARAFKHRKKRNSESIYGTTLNLSSARKLILKFKTENKDARNPWRNFKSMSEEQQNELMRTKLSITGKGMSKKYPDVLKGTQIDIGDKKRKGVHNLIIETESGVKVNVMRKGDKGEECDHKDGNPANNKKENLRIMRKTMNSMRKGADELKIRKHRRQFRFGKPLWNYMNRNWKKKATFLKFSPLKVSGYFKYKCVKHQVAAGMRTVHGEAHRNLAEAYKSAQAQALLLFLSIYEPEIFKMTYLTDEGDWTTDRCGLHDELVTAFVTREGSERLGNSEKPWMAQKAFENIYGQ